MCQKYGKCYCLPYPMAYASALLLPQRLALVSLEGLQEKVDDAFLSRFDFRAEGYAWVDLKVPVVHVEFFFFQGYHNPVKLAPFLVFNGVRAGLPTSRRLRYGCPSAHRKIGILSDADAGLFGVNFYTCNCCLSFVSIFLIFA